MAVKLYIWRGRDAWLAQCPALEIGGIGRTRGEAVREARSEADHEAMMVLGAGVEVIDGPPPAGE